MSLSMQLRNRRRRRRALVGVVVVLLIAALAAGVGVWRFVAAADQRAATRAAEGFAAAWSAGRLDTVAYAQEPGKKVTAAYEQIVDGLGADDVRVNVDRVTVDGDRATAALGVTWRLAGKTRWNYSTSAILARDGGEWVVRWTPSIVHPKLGRDDQLTAEHNRERASILDRDGQPLFAERPVVEVGVIPGKVPDPAAVADSLRDILDIDAEGLEERIRDAGDDIFVSVITLRTADFQPVEARLRALPGVAWNDDTRLLAPTTEFARALLGQVGPVTAEIIRKSDGRYQAGDLAGLSGLQRRYDQRLAGTPSLRVLATPANDEGEPTVLFTRKGTSGQSVRTTLDPRVQRAADAALSGITEDSALVAVHVPTGEVLAVANGPEPGGYNRALRGKYPPGSTFKVASTLALLRAGVGVDETVPCPKYATVQGKSWSNYNNFALGPIHFDTAFAKSCNTAFIGLAKRLDDRALTEAAATLGIGRPYDLGTPAFAGDVPTTTSPIDHAATMIGQARVLASPLAMATMAATVARGGYKPPHLVTEPRPQRATEQTTTAQPLTSAEAETLRRLMRSVVTSGSGQAVADVPGDRVAAKTGTAEYGTANPPKTHVWFVGFQDDIAFAVFVANGDSGGTVAAPIAADFLRALHS